MKVLQKIACLGLFYAFVLFVGGSCPFAMAMPTPAQAAEAGSPKGLVYNTCEAGRQTFSACYFNCGNSIFSQVAVKKLSDYNEWFPAAGILGLVFLMWSFVATDRFSPLDSPPLGFSFATENLLTVSKKE